MNVADLVSALERIAPTHYAEPWDNVGLLVGDSAASVSRVMLAIDYTADVAAETLAAQCEMVVAYHPPIFKPRPRFVAADLAFEAARSGIALYSPHTALDIANGGTNDMLADAIGLGERRPLRLAATKDTQLKLVFFAPAAAVETISRAVFDAGAGRIGAYSSCSFRAPGTGTFFGEEGTSPAVGAAGMLERVDEIKVETLVPTGRITDIIAALRASHPYEEPAFDLVRLAAPPAGRGMGRVGDMTETPFDEVFSRIKRELGIAHALVCGPRAPVRRAAACAGACGDLLDDAISSGAQLYLTGEMRHHDALRAAAAGLTVVCALHSNSERAMLRRLEARLATELPGLDVRVSERDRDPFVIA